MASNTVACKKDKRERSANYSDQETRLLVNLVLEFREVIENKVSDAVSWKQKQGAWEKLAISFNSRSGDNIHRDANTLKAKYESIKKALKKKVAKDRVETFKTGGGSKVTVIFKDWEEKLIAVLKLMVLGLDTDFDCDTHQNVPTTSPKESETEPLILAEVEGNGDSTTYISPRMESVYSNEASPDVNQEIGNTSDWDGVGNHGSGDGNADCSSTSVWDSWSPGLLRTKKSFALQTQRNQLHALSVQVTDAPVVATSPNEALPDAIEGPQPQVGKSPTSRNLRCAALRVQKGLGLQKRQSTPKKTVINNKYDALADDRRNLVKLQAEVAKQELELLNARVAHEAEMRSMEKERLSKTMKYEQQEHELKIQLLKKQLALEQ